jgi:hypothetical protein
VGNGTDRKRCRHCGGQSETIQASGWLMLTVGVPTEVDGRGWKWVGVFCCVACLAAHGPELDRMERLAEAVFAREVPR